MIKSVSRNELRKVRHARVRNKVKGTNDIIGYLKKYKKNGRKKFNSLQEYNENITNELEKIFNN